MMLYMPMKQVCASKANYNGPILQPPLFFTYLFVHKNRGKEALESEGSILNRLNGWLVHDSWSSYFSFKNYKHAMCGAHILRELQGLVDTGESKWAKNFQDVFDECL